MKKRIFGMASAVLVLLTTVMSLFAMPVGAAAGVTVTVGSVSGAIDDVVKVPVSISAESYLVNADMHVMFDTTKLQLVDVFDVDGESSCYDVNEELFGTRWMYLGNERTPGDFVFSAATGSNTGLEAGGVMFTLAFKIVAEGETALTFTADPIDANDGNGEIDADGYPSDYALTYTVVNGTATAKGKRGDMNGDKAVNMFDALILYSAASGRRDLTEDQYAVADMNGDGVINMIDVLTLFRKASGY